MTRVSAAFAAALALSAALMPAFSAPAEARHRHHGAGLAAGIALGVIAGAIIAGSRSARADNYEHRRWVNRCNRWYRQCQDGNDYACEKFETRGCTE